MTSPYRSSFSSRSADEVLTAEDIDTFIELRNSYLWDTDKPFRAFLLSESVPFEYEFVEEFPKEDTKMFKSDVRVEWSQHGHLWWEKDVDHTNPDHLFRHVFQKFVLLWKGHMERNPQFGMFKLRIYRGSRFYSGLCSPGDICSLSRFIVPLEFLIMYEGVWGHTHNRIQELMPLKSSHY